MNRLAKIRQLPCCNCGYMPPSQAAHSNFSEHGKGRGIKADDIYTIPLCIKCHQWFDQYQDGLTRDEAKRWFLAKLNLVNKALEQQDIWQL